jgi:hypothetical protein
VSCLQWHRAGFWSAGSFIRAQGKVPFVCLLLLLQQSFGPGGFMAQHMYVLGLRGCFCLHLCSNVRSGTSWQCWMFSLQTLRVCFVSAGDCGFFAQLCYCFLEQWSHAGSAVVDVCSAHGGTFGLKTACLLASAPFICLGCQCAGLKLVFLLSAVSLLLLPYFCRFSLLSAQCSL